MRKQHLVNHSDVYSYRHYSLRYESAHQHKHRLLWCENIAKETHLVLIKRYKSYSAYILFAIPHFVFIAYVWKLASICMHSSLDLSRVCMICWYGWVCVCVCTLIKIIPWFWLHFRSISCVGVRVWHISPSARDSIKSSKERAIAYSIRKWLSVLFQCCFLSDSLFFFRCIRLKHHKKWRWFCFSPLLRVPEIGISCSCWIHKPKTSKANEFTQSTYKSGASVVFVVKTIRYFAIITVNCISMLVNLSSTNPSRFPSLIPFNSTVCYSYSLLLIHYNFQSICCLSVWIVLIFQHNYKPV